MTDVEHRAADPDELAEANQEGYNEGNNLGFNDGILHAAQLAIDLAGEHFKNGNDKLAGIMRDHYARVRMELRETPEKGLTHDN